MSNKREWFVNFKRQEGRRQVRVGDGRLIPVQGTGDVNIMAYDGQDWVEKHLKNVLFVPQLRYNLFSLGATLDNGATIESSSTTCKLFREGRTVAVGAREGRLFKMTFKIPGQKQAEANMATSSLRTWHERLGHQNFNHVQKYLERQKIDYKKEQEKLTCEPCITGKMHRFPFPESKTKTQAIGEVIHADLAGPMQENSLGGARYFLQLKDDFSHWRTVRFLKQKSETAGHLENFIKETNKHVEKGIKILRTDNGLEFVNKQVAELTRDWGIKHQKTVPYTPEQNGAAERENRTVVEAARTLIYSAGLPLKMWAEAVNTAVFVLNLTGTSSVPGSTPHLLWHGREGDYNRLQVFGEKVHVHIPKEKRRKWDRKSEEGVFVGYGEDVKGYRIWFPKENDLRTHRDVIFTGRLFDESIEREPPEAVTKPVVDFLEIELNPPQDVEVTTPTEEEQSQEEFCDACDEYTFDTEESPEPDFTVLPQTTPAGSDRSGRVLRDRRSIRPPSRFADQAFSFAAIDDEDDPKFFQEAVAGRDSKKWQRAMDEEIDSLHKNQTWKLMPKPKDQAIVDNKWVYKTKRDSDGMIDRYKARLVARGFTQRAGIDYNETFSPVVKFDSIRAILSIAASGGLKLLQFDVRTAFLHGELEETIYMHQPEGYDDGSGRVCELRRSLYGLKQASRCWNQKFVAVLGSFGLSPTSADTCVFTGNNGGRIILAIHIDDGLIAAENQEAANSLLSALRDNFEVTSSSLGIYLGLQINQHEDGSIFVHQEAFLRRVLEKFRMDNANPVTIPSDQHQEMCAAAHLNGDEPAKAPYREAIGSLMYLSIGTRPDISYAVNRASQHLVDPKKIHWNSVKRILKYLKGAPRHGLLFSKQDYNKVVAFSDSDYAGDTETRKSTTGVVVKLGDNIVSWSSRKQRVVALSTTEAEYIAACHAAKDILWMKHLVSELTGRAFSGHLLIDNQGALALIKNPEHHRRTKHIDVRYHFIRQKYLEGHFQLEHVASMDQQADILTKPLPRERFQRLREKINVVEKL